MAGKASFTDDEWHALERGVTGAGMFVSLSEPDFNHAPNEESAFKQYVVGQGETSANQLVRELAEVYKRPFGIMASSDKIEGEALAALRVAAATLAAKAPNDVEAYRDLVLGAADVVAQSRAGERQHETVAIAKIREALGMP